MSAGSYKELVVSLATGTLAIHFLALTSEAKPALSRYQRGIAIAALAVMVLCVAAGVLGMYADAIRNYFWASALQAADSKGS